MTIHFAANEFDALTGTAGVTTTTTFFNNSFTRCAWGGTGSGQTVIASLPAAVDADSATGWWAHLWAYAAYGPFFDTPWLEIKDGSANTVLSAAATNADITFTLTVGGASDSSAVIAHPIGTLSSWDFHCYTSAGSTYLEIYLNKALVDILTVSGTNPGLKQLTAKTAINTQSHYFSEFILADTDTRELRVLTCYPSGNGAHTAGVGTYADIDETATDASAITLESVGDMETWTVTRVSAPAAAGVLAVCVNGLVASDGANDMQAVVRISGTDYLSADLGLTNVITPSCVVWNTNPATSDSWGVLNPATLEYGYKAVA